MVALGNEITTGFCGEIEWQKIIEILNPCADVVKQILPDILIAPISQILKGNGV